MSQRFKGFHGSNIIVKDPRKRRVLSNKALTKKVRALDNKKGQYEVHQPVVLYDAVTLTAGTEDLNYMTGEAIVGDEQYAIGYIVHWKALCSTAGGATLRVLFCTDEQESDTDYTSVLGTNSVGINDVANFVPLFLRKHKDNMTAIPGAIIHKDMLIALNNGEPKAGSFYVNMHRRYQGAIKGFDNFVTALADEADVLFSLNVRLITYNRLIG